MLEECAGVVDALVASTAEMMEGVTPYAKKSNQRIERKIAWKKQREHT